MIVAPPKVRLAPSNGIPHRWIESLKGIQRPPYAVAAEIALQAVTAGLIGIGNVQRMPLLTPDVIDERCIELNPDIQEVIDERRLPDGTKGLVATGVAALILLHGASAALRAPSKIVLSRDTRFTATGSNLQISTRETGRGRDVGKAMELDVPVDTLTLRTHKDMGYDTIQVSAQTASGVNRFAELSIVPSARSHDNNHNIVMASGMVYMGIPDMSPGLHPELVEYAGRGLMVAAHPL